MRTENEVKPSRSALLLLAVPTLLLACKPTPDDVASAQAKRNVKQLQEYLHHEMQELHEPALRALIGLATNETLEAEARLLVSSRDFALLEVALETWPDHPALLAAAWDESTRSSEFDTIQRVINSASRGTHIGPFADFMKERVQDLRGRLASEPEKLVRVLDSLLVLLPKLPALARARVEAGEEILSARGKSVTWSQVHTQLAETRAIQERLSGADSADRCLVADSLSRLLPFLVRLSDRAEFDARMAELSPALCEDRKLALRTAVDAALAALDVGTEAGRRTVVSPAESCCWNAQERICETWLSTKQACDEHGNWTWKQVRAAQYEFDPSYGPAEDAAKLRTAADLLTLLAVIEPSRDRSPLIVLLRGLADEESKLPSDASASALAKDVEAMREQRSEYLYLNGYIVAKLDTASYEFATVHAVPSCMAIACPSPPNLKEGKHSILRLTKTEFTTKGLFSIWAKRTPDEEITTKDGFKETWNTFREVSESIPKGLEEQISEKQKQLAALRKSTVDQLSRVSARRKQAGMQIAQELRGSDR